MKGDSIMQPERSILDASFRYVPSFATSVATTWRRAGWQPTTEEQRKARQKSDSGTATALNADLDEHAYSRYVAGTR
jgi:hypothetical protein